MLEIATDLKECVLDGESLPQEEKYKLVDQIVRASRSVTANIAEGFGRFHYQSTYNFADRAGVRCMS